MQENDYLFLLYKQLNGEIIPAETALLDEWLRQSAENRRLADEVRQVWDQTGHYAPAVTADKDAGFARVQAKIRAAETRPATRVVPLYRSWMRVAAAIALLAAGIWAFRQWTGADSPALRIEMAGNEASHSFELPDGSRVWLRQGSRLEFPPAFSNAERRVKLRGEGYFDVTHDAARPFRVELNDGEQVQVLGTQFAVKTLPGEAPAVLVKTGKVHFSPDGRREGVYLTAGKKAVYDRANTRFTLTDLTSFNELAWQAGGLEFVRTPLAQVVADLEKWYGVSIDLKNKALNECPYTAPLADRPLPQVLGSLELVYGFRVRQSGEGLYILEGGQCR